ncbi:DegT/DnrJ/EryC1/StrS family aminotransferase [Aureivirga marina]|uniref:DegT/DnrJ/EryC1/StrS family aminotransferase n=1 Tax=Aureivirga marina TaxID=1182451 RepID=UPI0018CA44E0|nr:aminotransferase class I/II-fold pyridoxal phosphate-dependent enzyme [Aureivirga marina]
MNKRIWLSSPHMGGTEQSYINQAFEENWIAPLGPNVNGFEADLKKYTGVNSCTALTSGTAAIHLGLIQLGVKKGDEVLCSTFTFVATVNPIIYQDATPIFVDSEEDTWNMCPKQLEIAIKDRIAKGTKPKAIIVVHLYGMPSKMNEIMEISKKYEIPVLEDAAEALGSTYEGKAMGTIGDIGIYSFNGNKIITTSGGGAIVSNKEEYCQDSLFLATQARDAAPHYQHSRIGYNYRMSNITAGIGRGQMEILDKHISLRRRNHDFYEKELSGIENIKFLKEPEGMYSNRWLSCILTDSFETREKIRIALEAKNIESRPLWKPMHMQPVFINSEKYLNGVSEDLFKKGLCLPSGSNLEIDDLELIVKVIKENI